MKIIGRDEIALEAMKFFCTPQTLAFYKLESTEDYDKMVAKRSYQIADAMILERDKRYAENYVLNASPDSAPTVQKA